jgi:hypothetical protein
MILAMLALIHHHLSGGGKWSIAGACALAFITYSLKIQFIYIAAVPPLALAIEALFGWMAGRPRTSGGITGIAIAALCTLGFFGLFTMVWIVPNQALFFRVVSTQSHEHTTRLTQVFSMLASNVQSIAAEKRAWPPLAIALIGMFCMGFDLVRRRRSYLSNRWTSIIVPPLAWVAVESHKLLLSYLPSRYFTSFLVSIGLFGVALCVLWVQSPEKSVSDREAISKTTSLARSWPVLVAGLALIIANLTFYAKSVADRRFTIASAQAELAARQEWSGKLAVGSWAPMLLWGTSATTKPVWADYFNDKRIIETLHPDAIFTEPSQGESGGAFRLDGIVFGSPARTFRINRWTVDYFPLASTSGGANFSNHGDSLHKR